MLQSNFHANNEKQKVLHSANSRPDPVFGKSRPAPYYWETQLLHLGDGSLVKLFASGGISEELAGFTAPKSIAFADSSGDLMARLECTFHFYIG